MGLASVQRSLGYVIVQLLSLIFERNKKDGFSFLIKISRRPLLNYKKKGISSILSNT